MGVNGAPHHNGSCTGKIKYLRRDLAEFEARRLANQLNHATAVYLCKQCGEFHVGKNPKGPFIPGAALEPEGEFEREELVQRKIGIEAAIDELRYGPAVDRGWEKKRRLVAERNAIELRLAQIKQLRRAAHEERMRAQEVHHVHIRQDDPSEDTQAGRTTALERE